MKPHPITQFSRWDKRSQQVLFGTERFELAYGEPFGDEVLAVIFPDPVQTLGEARHAAAVNGRSRPYPADAVVYAQAIGRTLVTPAGHEAPDVTQLLRLFDAQTELFQLLAEAALAVMGVGTGEPEIGGIDSWTKVHAALSQGEVSRAMALCEGAMRALRGDGPAEIELGSPLLEAALGNDCGAAD